ncbi:red chlorophyll catabolite reductase [Parahaliea maris]|uniref:Red chlorophyll catabolite reductase n=1 Tax=Parahaliea maris TaxID=2716870 RepID=A0A5C9A8N7_9GAMM|nr:red chlorophyll catabolite reductase [Parahaliea maris]TXS96412.1 red chlorophyll catabolite reductase [Parahaliea maris]
MSERILTSIADMVEQTPDVDNRSVFSQLWDILGEMDRRIRDRFELQRDPCSDRFADYRKLGSESEGSLSTYSGPEVDWYVHSYIGSPESTFTNMHITLSLGPQSRVPHFGFAFGTVPDIFVYMDYLPRCDLAENPQYLDHYYTEMNQEYLRLQADERLNPFISQDLYTRVALTPTAVCYTAKVDDDVIANLRTIALERLERWFGWVDAAEATAPGEREALARRDELIRRTICERDPANVLAERLFGKDIADTMVTTLWGGNRTLPRPGLS